jgi:ACS family tartrate transporter-like MFS transporter
MVCYLLALIDRGNIGMASLQMNHDLGITPKVFGFAGSLFFIAYFLFEVPEQPGAAEVRRAQVDRPDHDHLGAGIGRDRAGTGAELAVRHALHPGRCRSRLLPRRVCSTSPTGSRRLPRAHRRHLHGGGANGQLRRFAPVRPAAAADGLLGLRGWHWLFILEGLPTAILGLVCLFFLTDRPEQANWLNEEQRNWL